jgi:hypothetical protein
MTFRPMLLLSIHGAIPPLPHIPLCRVEAQLLRYLLVAYFSAYSVQFVTFIRRRKLICQCLTQFAPCVNSIRGRRCLQVWFDVFGVS